jgi:para-nitrobenzyl esterase
MRLGPILLASLVLACGSEPPPRPAADPATRRTLAQGELVGFAKDGAHVWRGIPFARPPVGELRWRAPLPPEPWPGVREALAFGSACVQFAGPLGGPDGEDAGAPRGSEDCLTLNVYAPASGGEGLPVMFWIHGGGNTIGDAHVYDASHLAATQGVVVVTTHYRLGAFGWFAHPALRGEGTSADDRSGNFGTLDLVRALEWVRDEIVRFGGDAARVTIFGESAGARNVFSLLQSPRAKGLFHRAIVQSGGVWSTSFAEAEDDHAASSNTILARLLVADGSAVDEPAAHARVAEWSDAEVARYLRGKRADEILARYDGSRLGGMYDCPQLFRDGAVLPAGDPLEVFATPGGYNAVPTIVGTNRDETKLFMAFGSPFVTRVFGVPVRIADPERYDVHAEYGSLLWKASGADEPLAALRRAQGPSVFGYRFDWDEEPTLLWLDFARLFGAAHGVEISFVFGRLDVGRANRFVFDEARRPAAEILSARMVSYWTEFAATGDPGRGRDGTLPQWSAWDDSRPDAPRFMVFDTEADGGVRMSSESVTRQALLERVLAESRFGGPPERCAFLREMIPRNLSAAEYTSLGGGACAAFPLEQRAVGG